MDECKRQKAYYMWVFGTTRPDRDDINAALTKAHEIRQFEINLYWKRSLFFWGFILTFFGGFIALKKIGALEIDILITLVALSYLGLFTSLAWGKLEGGARAWQKNWEYHIDFLENDITGKLHKTILGNKKKFFSISKIHNTFIWTITLVWITITLSTVYGFFNKIYSHPKMVLLDWLCPWIISIVAIFGIYLCLISEKSKFTGYWRTSDKSLPYKGPPCDGPAFYQRELPNIKFPEK